MKRVAFACLLVCALGGGAGVAYASGDAPDWGQLRHDIDAGPRGPDRDAFEARRRAIRERARARFAAADRDGDGKLNRDEVAALRPALARHFDRIDADHDGLLSEQELADALHRLHMRRHENFYRAPPPRESAR